MKRFLSLTAIVALLALTACSKNSELTEAGTENEESISLEKEFGGYDSSSEAPAFGDSEMMSDFEADEDVNDAYSNDAEVLDALSYSQDPTVVRDNLIKAYFVRLTYGLLAGDSLATEVIDWSGSLEVNKGILVVLKKIRFEDNDFIHLPRDSRTKVDITSQTKQHLDGLLLAVVDNDTTDDEGFLTINIGGYSTTLAFADMDSLESLEAVGAGGHEVSIIARSKDYVPFNGGFISGHWKKDRDNGGIFRGRWINSLGLNGGYLRGIWGKDRGGSNVFKGKYISLNGEFRGLLAGHWENTRDTNGGVFNGRWVNRNHDTIGHVRGNFRTGRSGDGRGFFQGRYAVRTQDNLEATN